MCGLKSFNPINIVKNAIRNPLQTIGTAAGAYFGGPIGAGLGNTLGGVASGKPIGKAALSGLEAGLGDYGLEQLGGLAGSAFPETMASINGGIGDVKSSLGLGGDGAGAVAGAGGADAASVPSFATGYSPADFGGAADAIDPSQLDQLGAGSAVTAGSVAPGTVDFAGSTPLNPSFRDTLSNFASNPGLSTAGDVAKTGGKSIIDSVSNASPTQLLAGGGLALNALAGNKNSPAEKNLAGISDEQRGIANTLVSDAQAGRLPAGQDQEIQQQTADAISQIKSKYASMGMSGSSSEQQAISQVTQQAQSKRSEMLQANLAQGLQALGGAAGSSQQIIQNQLANDKSLYNSLIELAGTGAGVTNKDQTYKLSAA